MQSGNSLRDRHIQGRDWLRADENPNIVFELEGLEEIEQTTEDNQIRVEAIAVGKLTVNGVTVDSRTPVKLAILPETNRVRIQTDFQVRLRDHEVQGRRGAIGDEVAEVIEIEGVLYGSWE
jgi:polyisoprenoid-binding protein YceI